MVRKFSVVLCVSAVCVLADGALAAGDPEKGANVFRRCAACHSLEPGKIKVGPPLAGLIGRKAGTVERFRYSSAMKSADVVWTAETLDKYLAAPKTFIPGNRMPFPGLKDSQDRADVISYLKKVAVKE